MAKVAKKQWTCLTFAAYNISVVSYVCHIIRPLNASCIQNYIRKQICHITRLNGRIFTRIFQALNTQKNNDIQPRPNKQYSVKKEYNLKAERPVEGLKVEKSGIVCHKCLHSTINFYPP